MEAPDWLDKTIQRTKKKYQAQRTKEEVLAHEEAERRRLCGQFCRELFGWLENIEASFNNKFGAHVLAVSVVGANGSRSVRILARPTRTQESIAELNYQENSNSLGWSMGFGGAANAIRLILSPGGATLAAIGEEYYTPEQLGQKIIEDLLA